MNNIQHMITLADLPADEVRSLVHISRDIKLNYLRGIRDNLLAGKVMALLFEKPSLRTRISFQALMTHLGGDSLVLGEDTGWGKREPIEDFIPILSSYVDIIVARTMSHETLLKIAEHSSCTVINGLTDLCHPCQALADFLTAFEHFGSFDFVKLAYVGDANNVAHSLAIGCSKLNLDFTIGCPEGYQFEQSFIDDLNDDSDATIRQVADPVEAVAGATVIYTDVWASMGQEAEQQQRLEAFKAFQVNDDLFSKAHRDAIFLHCLPAKRGEEVTVEVIDGPQSKIKLQAENRLHAQKGLVYYLMNL